MNVTRKQRIREFISTKYGDDVISLFHYIIKLCKNGSIKNISKREKGIANSIFDGEIERYYMALEALQEDLNVQIENDTLYISFNSKNKDQVLDSILKKYQTDVIALFNIFLDTCKNGVISNYKEKEESIVDKQFDGNYSRYYRLLDILIRDCIVRLDGVSLYILLWDPAYLFTLRYNLNNKNKRKYSRSVNGQASILEYHKKDNVISLTQNKELEGKGVKIPDTIFKYLVSEPITKEERENILLKDLIEKEIMRRNLSREVKRYYLALLSISNTKGVIVDFNVHLAIAEVKRLYSDIYAESTCYYAHEKLLECGLITEYKHEKRGCDCLRIEYYDEGFGKGHRYVVLPYSIIFTPEFKKLPKQSINLCLQWLIQLNNGELGTEKLSGKDKLIQYKLYRRATDTKKDKDKFENNLTLQFKRRCNSEIGFIAEPLGVFFDIKENTDSRRSGYYDINLKEKFFIKKEQAKKFEKFVDPIKRYSKKADIINEIIIKRSIKISYEDRQDIVRVLHRASKKVIERIISTLDADMRNRWVKDREPIRSIGAYTKWLYEEYSKGDRSILYEKLYRYYSEEIKDITENDIDDEHLKEFQELFDDEIIA